MLRHRLTAFRVAGDDGGSSWTASGEERPAAAALIAAQRAAMAPLAMMDRVWRGPAWAVRREAQRHADGTDRTVPRRFDKGHRRPRLRRGRPGWLQRLRGHLLQPGDTRLQPALARLGECRRFRPQANGRWLRVGDPRWAGDPALHGGHDLGRTRASLAKPEANAWYARRPAGQVAGARGAAEWTCVESL